MTFRSDLGDLAPEQLGGFFEDWPYPPAADEHLEVLRGSDAVELALDDSGRAVGFAAAITDGVMTLFITLVEVLPEYRRQGLGSELVRRLGDRFAHLRYRCLHCDEELVPFYRRLGYQVCPGVQMLRYRG